ncbi:MAG: ROK family protein [Desulfobacterales bacterium]|jgi:glucokinase
MGLTAVGVDLGGTKIAAALVNEQGQILKSSRLSTNVEGGASAVVAQTTELVKELAGISGSSVVGIGVGVAGQIEAESGVVRFAPNLDWHDVPLQSQLSAACSLPVVITNDVRAITWGEWLFGAGKGCDDLICAFVGTGIGGGVVINGKVVSGCSNTAGEIGHITIDLHGSKCSCGNHGCLETLAGGWGIAHQAEQAVAADPAAGVKLLAMADGKAQEISAKMVAEAYRKGDALAKKLVVQTGEALVAGMVSLVNAFNPCRLILGGGVIDGLPELVERVKQGVSEKALAAAASSLQVVSAQLDEDAGAIGAAAFAMQSLKP